MSRWKAGSKSVDKIMTNDYPRLTDFSPQLGPKKSPKRLNCMKETMNFLKQREETRKTQIRNQAFGLVREYVEGRKNQMISKNNDQSEAEEMRNQLKSNFMHPKGKPLVYLEGNTFLNYKNLLIHTNRCCKLQEDS